MMLGLRHNLFVSCTSCRFLNLTYFYFVFISIFLYPLFIDPVIDPWISRILSDVPRGGNLTTLSCSSFFVCSFLSRSRWICDGSAMDPMSGCLRRSVGLNEGPEEKRSD